MGPTFESLPIASSNEVKSIVTWLSISKAMLAGRRWQCKQWSIGWGGMELWGNDASLGYRRLDSGQVVKAQIAQTIIWSRSPRAVNQKTIRPLARPAV
ncbi:unnamed protein product [Protopolystoma xenopodis]|uniref:Uncharacterized protein n=1 Tax=Protopolystoma xenopodis TaxID=117903 RepID=A0A3S5BUK1_9PLAT|nr:unnamed protein product [Protopolystoma xenopodis]